MIPTTTEDQVWLSVARTIGGSVVRHVEYMPAREWADTRDYHGVDGGVDWNGGASVAVTSISAADPAVCTATGHGFSNDYLVRFSGVTGNTTVNGEVYTVKNKTANDFQLYTRDGSTAIDFSALAAGTGGTVERVAISVTGLTHLNGETVKAWGDGGTLSDEVVAAGSVTFDEYANRIHVGLPFTAALEPMPAAEAPNKLKRVAKVWGRFFQTVDAWAGQDSTSMKQITFEGLPDIDTTPPVHTEGAKLMVDGTAGYDGAVRIESREPGPCTVLSIISELVQER
jgi:hypothetical protein